MFYLPQYCAGVHAKAVSRIKTTADPEERDRSIATHTPFLKQVSASGQPESTFNISLEHSFGSDIRMPSFLMNWRTSWRCELLGVQSGPGNTAPSFHFGVQTLSRCYHLVWGEFLALEEAVLRVAHSTFKPSIRYLEQRSLHRTSTSSSLPRRAQLRV